MELLAILRSAHKISSAFCSLQNSTGNAYLPAASAFALLEYVLALLCINCTLLIYLTSKAAVTYLVRKYLLEDPASKKGSKKGCQGQDRLSEQGPYA